MVVIIPHPTEELKLVNIQKKLIEQFNSDDGKTIWYTQVPLYIPLPQIECNSVKELKEFAKEIETVTAESFTLSDSKTQVIMPVLVKTKKETLKTELPLIHQLKSEKTDDEKIALLPPVFKQCQVAIVEKLHDASATVQSSKTSSYILKDSVWFKQAK